MAQNVIGIFDASCPSGWTRVSAFDGKFVRGSASYGGTGGSSTHTHNFDISAGVTGLSTFNLSTGPGDTAMALQHTHTLPAESGITSGSASSLPAYIDVVFCFYSEGF